MMHPHLLLWSLGVEENDVPHLLLWSLGVEENDTSPPPSMESGGRGQ